MGQKVLFRAQLKYWSAKGASHHPAFMVLVLIKEMRRGGDSKISFCYGLGV